MTPKHPARFVPWLVELAAPHLASTRRMGALAASVLDPFAGTGLIHSLRVHGDFDTTGVEIEPEWAEMHPRTVVGDALNLPFRENSFDAVFTSPTFGNRFADHHQARDGSRRRSYTHDLGRNLHPNNSGSLHWGPEYRLFHEAAWVEVRRVVRPGGRFVLNIKNHIRRKTEQPVVEWHLSTILTQGWTLAWIIPVPAKGLRDGENRDARVPYEFLLVFDH